MRAFTLNIILNIQNLKDKRQGEGQWPHIGTSARREDLVFR